MQKKDLLKISSRKITSRLFLGTGKFSSFLVMKKAIASSGADIVTVAIRRVDLENPRNHILNHLDRKKYLILPNTSGAKTADEAVRLARIAGAFGLSKWLKLEVIPDPRYLLPDPVETLRAAEILVKEKFTVLAYINADPVLAKKLEDAGCAAVMPLGAPIGSAQGIRTRSNIEIIIEQANIPIIVDAGLGAPSHAAEAMEMGADAVLVNTAIAAASDPIAMACAFKLAVQAGRISFLSGLIPKSRYAQASSPLHL